MIAHWWLEPRYAIRVCTTAHSIEELAVKLGLGRKGLARTLNESNGTVQEGTLDPVNKDDKHSEGKQFKSNLPRGWTPRHS